jgi:BioD-like phosphotransacetylase family protein
MNGELSREVIVQQMLDAIAELDAKNDFLIIEGAGHTGVGSVIGCNNARIARLTDSPVVMVTGGGLGNVVDSAMMNFALFQKEQAEVKAILVNKIIAEKREQTLKYLEMAFEPEGIQVVGGFNYQPILANPTLRRIASVLGVKLHATDTEAQRIVHNVQIGAASAQRVAELLQESSIVIVNSSRDELLMTIANLYQIEEYHKKIAGIIIPGVGQISHITQRILDKSGIPYMRAMRTSSTVFEIINDDVSKLTIEDTHKLRMITDLAEKRFNFDAIDALLN